MAFLRLQTGDGLAFAHIQRAWGRDLVNPIDALLTLTQMTWPLTPDAMIVGTWTVGAIFGLWLSAVLALQRRIPAAIFCALCILLSLSGGVTSMVRFVAGLAPLGMGVASVFGKSRVLFVLAAAASVGLDVILTIGWIKSSAFVM